MTKDYDVLDGIKRNQSDALETAFDKGFQQGYEQGLSENLEKARKEEYDKGYSRGRVDATKRIKTDRDYVDAIKAQKDADALVEQGRAEAWELARKIVYEYRFDVLHDIFGVGKIFTLPPSEVEQRINEYVEKLKDKAIKREHEPHENT